MKVSRYNILQKDSENRYILYNTLFKNIVELDSQDEEMYRSIVNKKTKENRSEFYRTLQELNFIVEDDFDELAYFKLQWNRSLYASGILRHTVFPNLSCNLDCPYCFENKNGTFMTQETAEHYLAWLEPQLADIKYFYLNWFGGEPLMSKDIIRFISKRIIDLQAKYHFEYGSSVVTNGVLLDEQFIREMQDLKIESIQITLDGSRKFHDKYRFLKGSGKGTFDIILENLDTYARINVSDTASTIRINVTDDNYDSMSELLDSIPERVKKGYMLLFRWIYSHPQGRNPGMEFSSCQKGDAPFNNLATLYRMAEEKGFTTNSFDEGINYNFCECDFDNAIQIDQNGNLFMCSHSMDESEVVGNVKVGFGSQKNLSRYARFINVSPFEDTECLECNILPICKGGCRKARYLGKKVCSDVKYSIPQYILQKAERNYCKKNNGRRE